MPDYASEPPDYRYFDLAGSHADLGRALGLSDPPFTVQPWWAPVAPLPFTRECAAVVRAFHAPLMEEFLGYADAQRADPDALWQQCCRVDLKARFRLGAEGCSTFAWLDGERAVAGRNYDYWPMQARRQRIRFTPAARGAHASLGARGGAPCGRYDGLNRHGLFVSLHVVLTDPPDAIKPGIPFHLVARLALELCASAREAVDLLLRLPHLSALNYLVADPGMACVVEADPRRVRARDSDPGPGGARIAAATNHFRHPDMQPLQGRRATRSSACRLDYLTRQPGRDLAGARDVDDLLDRTQRILSDRGVPISGADGPLATLWSCAAELRSRRIRYAAGAPHMTPFVEHPSFASQAPGQPDEDGAGAAGASAAAGEMRVPGQVD
jgi:hypothetical protein